LGRVVVFGLDSLEPSLAFDELRAEMPVLSGLVDGGVHGRLHSTIPAITCPAWASMLTGRDPGALGLYGFRNRASAVYEELQQATSEGVRVPAVWDVCSDNDRTVTAIAVPPGYPPVPVNGEWVSCFLTPPSAPVYTYPPALAEEITRIAGTYQFDVENFRSEDRDRILRQTHDMTERRWQVALHLLEQRRSDFFICCEIGSDRMQHAFWKDHDPAHRGHDPASPYRTALRDYHRLLDGLLGEALARLDPDDTVLVVSDHGARRLEGGVRINEWLIQNGYLTLLEPPAQPSALRPHMVDWAHTTAWASGGYYGRVFLNVAGREPQGTVAPGEYESVRSKLAAELEAIPDETGKPLRTKAHRPEDLYEVRHGLPPDLIVYFDDLAWRAIGQVGTDGELHTFENDTGPDHANHAQHGVFVMRDPSGRRGDLGVVDILDVAPTIYDALQLEAPPGLTGKVIG
jgi:predicted AlkP superfamily phosphohydrolase/phosphomutase